MKTTSTIAALFLAGSGAAFPTIPKTFAPLRARNGTGPERLAEQIQTIDPETGACDLAATPECRTAAQLAPHMLAAFEKYGLTEAGQQAAVVALTVFESGPGYKYKHNVSPGVPGQGTSNMQSFGFNVEYANSFPELAPQVAALGVSADAAASASDATKNQLLALLKPDEYNFGSGPWFLATQCPEFPARLAAGTDDAYVAYLKECVGTELDPEGKRLEFWIKAKQAFGIGA